ncbi:MAG: hypothetical protein QOC82_1291 [Frankiaceae bacterium]|nr:hypothetical protein [Frankiaceae bacterium]
MSGTVVASLTAAAAALLVAVIERVFVHRSQLRAQRAASRQGAYAEFLTAELTAQMFDLGSGDDSDMDPGHTEALDRSARALAVIRMTAPEDVVRAADAYQRAMLAWSMSREPQSIEANRAREHFERAARKDLLPRSWWARLVS